ncbi:efflux RND transporter periplasmic adaptor subunit [Sphingomonas quercus]|uniref:Efflux RND transporter periplasmic adaptor subunit n=1 Tax=Sphingomonas quercus TaxID=2842451 RepID=A0ABS6BMP5_9SPHN|nr:efflux RND transporter periplasmic adaptor subunit [Sphingomonas quercus]MBU3078519.1 efflux RND transporter periplasmic adaptor subunit [Sphingomonas quercus]
MNDMATTQTDVGLDEFLGRSPPSPVARLLKWGSIAVGVVILLLLLSRCVFGGEGPVRYATEAVERGDLRVTVSATGNLQPTNQVDVGSEQSGLIEQVFVQNNDRVNQGAILARLDTSRLTDTLVQSQAQLASAEAQVAQAQATAQQSRATLNRQEEVYKLSGGKVPSETELDTARADYARAQANVRAAQASVEQAKALVSSNQTNLSKASIKSPVTGVVLSRQVEPGQTVAASFNTPVLFTIAEDLSKMELQVKVDEADVGQVKEGQRATFAVDAYPGRSFPARIIRVDVGANATKAATSTSSSGSSGTSAAATSTVIAYTAVLSVDNPELTLRPGMTATADIITAEKKNVLLVPNAALRFAPAQQGASGGVTSVLIPRGPRRGGAGAGKEATIGRGSVRAIYVVGADGKPQRMEVTVGDTDGAQTEVSGAELRPGMQVITGQLAAGAEQGARRQRNPGSGQQGGNGGGGEGRRP